MYIPVEDEEACQIIGEGLHTGLRKGSDAPGSTELWKSIAKSDKAWNDALAYLMWGLDYMGYRLCKAEDEVQDLSESAS